MVAKKKAQSVQGVEIITAYKGFNKDLACRGYQYEIGGTFTHDGDVGVCEGGFHACEHPLNVFDYYPPATSRFAEVVLSGKISRGEDDTKVAAAEITIKAELKFPDLIERAIKYVFDRATKEEGASATGVRGAASATGDQGAASATGVRGAASATGYQGAASATGYQGAASATGVRGAAMSSGFKGRVMGKNGNALFLVERETWDGRIIAVWAGIVGQGGIKEDVWYMLKDGKPVEC